MYHDFDVCFDHYTIRKHFQECIMLGSVTKKLSLKNIYIQFTLIFTFFLNFFFVLVYKDNTTCCREVKQYRIG